MTWYDKLNNYFPIEEMKSKKHVETLLEEKSHIYFKSESSKHVLLYVEEEDYIFIDYLLVSKHARGDGVGRQLLNHLKKKQKMIILEVEPATEEDKDSYKRLNFYKRSGFDHASSIVYERKSLATLEDNRMEILYWSHDDIPEKVIFDKMKRVYKNIHTYKDTDIYGKKYQSVDEVLQIQTSSKDNILHAI